MFKFWADNLVPSGEQQWEWDNFRQYVDPELRRWDVLVVTGGLARPARCEDDERAKYMSRRASAEAVRKTMGDDDIEAQKIEVGEPGSDTHCTVSLWVRKRRVSDGASTETAST
jgi:hypothetical protein